MAIGMPTAGRSGQGRCEKAGDGREPRSGRTNKTHKRRSEGHRQGKRRDEESGKEGRARPRRKQRREREEKREYEQRETVNKHKRAKQQLKRAKFAQENTKPQSPDTRRGNTGPSRDDETRAGRQRSADPHRLSTGDSRLMLRQLCFAQHDFPGLIPVG